MKAEEMLVEFSKVMTEEHNEIVAKLDTNKNVFALENKVESLESEVKWLRNIGYTMITALPFVLWFIYSQVQITAVSLASDEAVLEDVSDDLDKLRVDIRNIYVTRDTVQGLEHRLDKLQDIIVRELDD